MANVFGILTGIVLALAGFVAYKNKAAYQGEVTKLNTQKEELVASQKLLKTAQDGLTNTIAKRTEVDALVVTQGAQEVVQKKANEDLTQENVAKTAKIAPNKDKIASFKEKTSKVGDLNDLATKMRATKVELEEVDQSITARDAKLAGLTAQNNEAESSAKNTKIQFERFTTGQSLSSLSTTIRAIYPSWGFVTLACGNNGGVVANSMLEVIRNDQPIAKLLVTSVETNSASASIVPDSLNQDVILAVGDRVISTTKPVTASKPAPITTAIPSTPAAQPTAEPAAESVPPVVDPAAPVADPAAAADPAAPVADPAPATN